jgi:hypothetical protein
VIIVFVFCNKSRKKNCDNLNYFSILFRILSYNHSCASASVASDNQRYKEKEKEEENKNSIQKKQRQNLQ